jgi:hypothetical protein
MNAPKQSRRKVNAKKLEPIDWHEFANDAVLNGNMSTLYRRPATEDSTAYASPEALDEIVKRFRPGHIVLIGQRSDPGVCESAVGAMPTVGTTPAVGNKPTVGVEMGAANGNVAVPAPVTVPPTVGMLPTVGSMATGAEDQTTPPTMGLDARRRVKSIRDVQDALTLAGQVLYKAMYGAPDGAKSKGCTKGYRQLAAETYLDKDTVRDLIREFKEKGIVRETGTYDPDTRSAKTYEVLSYKAILQLWRDAGLVFVTTGRQRPTFCTADGRPLSFKPTVGIEYTVSRTPTVGMMPTVAERPLRSQAAQPLLATEVIQALQQITGSLIDQEAADRLIRNCRTEAADCTVEEIVEFAWSKAFLCRSGKLDNPIGFLITQVPKHFQGEAFKAYRENKRKEVEAAAVLAARDEERRRESERELAEIEHRHGVRSQIVERHRTEQGIDLKSVMQDSEADEALKEWAKRMMKLGHHYQPRYE